MENITSSKLFRTRQGTVVLGVVAAVLAAILLLVYLNQYRNSVNQGTALIQVLVAKSLIANGTSGDTVASSGLYQVTSIAAERGEDRRLHRPVEPQRHGGAA